MPKSSLKCVWRISNLISFAGNSFQGARLRFQALSIFCLRFSRVAKYDGRDPKMTWDLFLPPLPTQGTGHPDCRWKCIPQVLFRCYVSRCFWSSQRPAEVFEENWGQRTVIWDVGQRASVNFRRPRMVHGWMSSYPRFLFCLPASSASTILYWLGFPLL